MSESLKQRIGKLNQELALLKEERDKLYSEAKKWAEKRNYINEKIKKLRIEATSLKEERDSLNAEVQKLKSLREQAKTKRKEKHAQILELREKIGGLAERKPLQRMRHIQREIEMIEWKIQTTSLPVKDEEILISQVRNLETQLSTYKQLEKTKDELIVLRTEEKVLEAEAKSCHEKLAELVEKSQKLHEDMFENLNKASSLKVEADSAHQKYVAIKQQAQNLHQKCVELSDKAKTFEIQLQEAEYKKQAKRKRELLKELEERAFEKLKHGEKLTWEEFKILAEKKKI